eukprot:gene25057-biopygen8986
MPVPCPRHPSERFPPARVTPVPCPRQCPVTPGREPRGASDIGPCDAPAGGGGAPAGRGPPAAWVVVRNLHFWSRSAGDTMLTSATAVPNDALGGTSPSDSMLPWAELDAGYGSATESLSEKLLF